MCYHQSPWTFSGLLSSSNLYHLLSFDVCSFPVCLWIGIFSRLDYLNCSENFIYMRKINQNLYWKQTEWKLIGNKLRKSTNIERDMTRRSLLTEFFNLYSEKILRELGILPGFIISGHKLKSIKHPFDTVFMAETDIKLLEALEVSKGKWQEMSNHQL